MRIAILGPLQADSSGRSIEVSGSRLRRLIVRLAASAPDAVPIAALVEAIWQDEPPADSANALQTLVSRARRLLGEPSAILQQPGGYRLDADTDIGEFAAATERGRRALAAHDVVLAAADYAQALALWRGEPLTDLGDSDFAVGFRARLSEQHCQAIAGRVSADLDLGRAAEVIGELEALVSTHPLREQFAVLLMSALAAAGRSGEALAAYERTRQHLADELGADPGPELRACHLTVLRGQDSEPEPARRHNLRAQLTSFLGRQDEVRRVRELLSSGRLASVIGPGGAGKTRLATEVAASLSAQAPDGVWFVELAPVTDPANIAQAILASIGLAGAHVLDPGSERHRISTTERLLESLASSRCLLVIDNCEHLIAATAAILDRILRRCPGVRVLATSREPLGIDGETLCVLAPLDVPGEAMSAAEALSFASVQLFADRASGIQAGFALTEQNVAPVIDIVRRLDGLPLAIELAAARLRVLPVEEIAARLGDRFRLLSGGSRAAMPRHRTLRAVVEWSWELLSPPERALIERLSIFPAGATLASATAVCAGDTLPAAQITELLDSLVDKSLLRLDSDAEGLRYAMLETIREYGAERLAERGELEAARLAHGRHFAGVVAEADRWLRTAQQLPWLRMLDAEQDNILAALRFLGESGCVDDALSMAVSLGWYWMMLDLHSDAATWLDFALSLKGDHNPHTRLVAQGLRALNRFATAFERSGPDHQELVAELGELSAKLADVEDPKVALLRPLMLFFGGDIDHVKELLDAATRSTDIWVAATAYDFRSNVHENLGEVQAMRADVATALELFAEVGDRWGLATTLSQLALLHTLDGELDAAALEYQRAATHLGEFGATSDEALLHLRLADVHIRRGDLAEAEREIELIRTSSLALGSGLHRLLADIGQVALAVLRDDRPTMQRLLRELTARLDDYEVDNPLAGHMLAICQGATAALHLQLGHLDEARADLDQAWQAALATTDMPIAAGVAVSVALLRQLLGDPSGAAEVLGAAAQLRGSDDATDTRIASLRRSLISELGADFDTHYQRGKNSSREDALARCAPSSSGAAGVVASR